GQNVYPTLGCSFGIRLQNLYDDRKICHDRRLPGQYNPDIEVESWYVRVENRGQSRTICKDIIFGVQQNVHSIPGTFWFDRFDVAGKMLQIEETNVGIAYVLARLGDEDMGHFSPQKSARIKRTGYIITMN